MSEPLSVENYALAYLWFAACTGYTLLFSITVTIVIHISRKRRSSILKSQRAPRTPFSELEFNVATPTDTTKSRRVSFSRRTGVAEFATNEATTTWKNVYEEQNKSLESSGRDSLGVSRAPSVGHLGNRVFDQEDIVFELDLPTFSGPPPGLNQSVNITEQLALLETTADERKLTAPSHRFDLSEFTDHGRVFSEDLTNPVNNEMSNIHFNFSTLGGGANQVTDDLDAIKMDLELNSQPSNVCQGPSGRGDISQYIEFDLNTTQGPIRDTHESDMSITDTILSPKRELSNVDIPKPIDNWVENKENIVVNPYVTPDEEQNFAIHESPEKVLVFDGKKLKYAAIDADLDEIQDPTDEPKNKSLGNKSIERIKVLYADLNSAEPSRTNLALNTSGRTSFPGIQDDGLSGNMSMTAVVDIPQARTKIFDLDDGDMSTTKCVTEERKLDQQVDLVVTQALTKVLKESVENVSKSYKRTYEVEQKALANMVETEARSFHENLEKKNSKRQTIVFKENEGDISLTVCVPNDVISREANKTESSFNMSITKAIPNNLIESLAKDNPEYEEVEMSSVNMSMTKIVPANEIVEAFGGKNTDNLEISADMSMTKALTNFIVSDVVNRKFDEMDCNMSMTKPVPNIVVATLAAQNEEPEEMDISDINMSITKAVPNKILNDLAREMEIVEKEEKSDAMDISDANMSITKAVPIKILSDLARENQIDVKDENFETSAVKTAEMDSSETNMSMTKSVPQNILKHLTDDYQIPEEEDKKPEIESFSADMSMTKHLPNYIISNMSTQNQNHESADGLVCTNKRRKTIIFQDADISMTQAIPANFINEVKEKQTTIISSSSMLSPSTTSEHVSYSQSNQQTIDIHEKSHHRKSNATDVANLVKKTLCFEDTTVDVSNQTLAVSQNITKIISRQISPVSPRRSKSPKSPPIKSPEPRSPMTSPNKSCTGSSRYSVQKRSISPRPTSPDKDNKLLNLDKTGEKKRRSHSPETHNNMSRYMSARKSRQSAGRGSMNPFSNPSKATSPEQTTISPKNNVKMFQILNKTTSPETKDRNISGLNQSNREVIVYQASSPVKPSQQASGTSVFSETSTTSSTNSVESTTTSSDLLKSAYKSTTDTQGSSSNIDKTLHFFNQTAESKIDAEMSEESGRRQNVPSSKGDEFQKSSQKLNSSKPGITKLENPQLERRKTSPSKAESKFETPIKSIAYDQLDCNSKKSIKSPLDYTEHNCHQGSVSATPELLSEATSFHQSLIHTLSKNESLSAVATITETSCSPMSQSYVLEPSNVNQNPVSITEEIGLDPPSEQLAGYTNSQAVVPDLVTEISTQQTPSILSCAESAKADLPTSALKSSSSNESCKTLTDSPEITSEEEPHKPSETSTKTLLNNLLDMSDVSLPTACANVGQSSFKTHILSENRNKTICDVPFSPRGQDGGFANKTYPNIAKTTPIRNVTATTDVKKKITFSDKPKQLNYVPTDSDTNESNDGRVTLNRNPILSKDFGQKSDESDSSSVTDERTSKLLDIISVLTHPDADVLTSTDSEGQQSSKNLNYNFTSDTDGTSQVSIVQDGKMMRVHDCDSTDTDMTALRKPAYSSTDYSSNKINVIPTRCYDDVAENVNDLMKDLTKPRSDGYPFEDAPFQKKARRTPSICSTQVQATLATSSQVDLENLPYDSFYELTNSHQDGDKPLKGIIKQTTSGDVAMNDDYESVTLKLQKHQCDKNDDKVLVFDKTNPLNNIMIAPIDFTEAHQYNPESSDIETDRIEENSMAVNAVQMQPKSPSLVSEIEPMPEALSPKEVLRRSIIEVKDTEVNTVVAMKGTKELLDANSSLTLVEEQVGRRSTDTDLLDHKKKRMQVLFKSNDAHHDSSLEKSFLGRILPEIIPEAKSPKHAKNILKTPPLKSPSRSPRKSPTIRVPKLKLSLKSDPSDCSTKSAKKSPEDHKAKKRHHSPVTIQQFMTQFGAPGDMKTINKQLLLAIQDNTSFSSSGSDICEAKKSMEKTMEIDTSITSRDRLHSSGTQKSLASRSDTLPELVNETSSKNLLSVCDSGLNVVAQINMLPFMGGRECEWESSAGDTWSFRLLRGRIRLSLRLAHRLDNSPRRQVRADTPIRAVRLEPTHDEKPNTVSALCVRFAAEAMLSVAGGGCARAAAAPALLRRCAAVARMALQWGTAMHEAKTRLAYTVQDNIISLKVANIPLRSVWEVRLRVDMCASASGARLPPWPEAHDVRVEPVVTDYDVTPEDVERVLAGIKRDWGHVPKTIWKIFRYLKNKSKEDDILL